jgi:chromosome partitioning protein
MKTIVICIANQKGGVGKTTTAVTLAHGLALKGKNVLIIDLDPQGNVAKWLDIPKSDSVYEMLMTGKIRPDLIRMARERLSIVPGNERTVFAQIMLSVESKRSDYIAQILRPILRTGLDYILFDTSPSVGGLQERALYAAQVVIIPTETEYLSADAIADTLATVNDNARSGWQGGALVLPTKYNERRTNDKETLANLREIYRDQVLDPIHEAAVLKRCAAEAKTIWELGAESRAAEEYARLLYGIMELK